MNQQLAPIEVLIDDMTQGNLAGTVLNILALRGNRRNGNTVEITNNFLPGRPMTLSLGGWAIQRQRFATRVYMIYENQNDFSAVLRHFDFLSQFIEGNDRLIIVTHQLGGNLLSSVRRTWLQYNYSQVYVNMNNVDVDFILRTVYEAVCNDRRSAIASPNY